MTETQRAQNRSRDASDVERAAGATRAYHAMVGRRRMLVVALAMVAAGLFVADIAVGGSGLPAHELLAGVFTPWHAPDTIQQIVWNIRMPMSVTGVLVGASLAIAGVQMQTILNNPLAEPYTLGIAAAAGFGAALSVVWVHRPHRYSEQLSAHGCSR